MAKEQLIWLSIWEITSANSEKEISILDATQKDLHTS